MRQIVIAISAILILSGVSPANANDAAFGSFSALAWRNAPNQDPQDWSRESLLAGLPSLEQMQQQARATIIARLGMPGISYELYTPGMGRQARLDIYRLSAKNDRVFRIDYDAKDRLKSDEVESSSCGCPLCSQVPADTNAIVAMRVLARTALMGSGPYPAVTTRRQVEVLLGHAGQPHSVIEQIGGQAWVDYSDIWRIAGAGERFFIASGYVTVRDRETREDAELPITSYAIATVGPDCPSR